MGSSDEWTCLDLPTRDTCTGFLGIYSGSSDLKDLAFQVDVKSMGLEAEDHSASFTVSPKEIVRLLMGETSALRLIPGSKKISVAKVSEDELTIMAENRPMPFPKVTQLRKGVPTQADVFSTVLQTPLSLWFGAEVKMFLHWTDEPQSNDVPVHTFDKMCKYVQDDLPSFADKIMFGNMQKEFAEVGF